MKQFKLKLPKAAVIVNLQFKSGKLQEHTGKRYLHLKGMISAIWREQLHHEQLGAKSDF